MKKLYQWFHQWGCTHRSIAWMPGDDMRKYCMRCGKIFSEGKR